MRIVTNTTDQIVLRHRPTLMGGAFFVLGLIVTVVAAGAMLQGSDESWPGALTGLFLLILGAILLMAKAEVSADRTTGTLSIRSGMAWNPQIVTHPLSEVGAAFVRTTMQSGKGGRYPVYKATLRLNSGMDKGDHGLLVASSKKRKVSVAVETLNNWLGRDTGGT